MPGRFCGAEKSTVGLALSKEYNLVLRLPGMLMKDVREARKVSTIIDRKYHSDYVIGSKVRCQSYTYLANIKYTIVITQETTAMTAYMGESCNRNAVERCNSSLDVHKQMFIQG